MEIATKNVVKSTQATHTKKKKICLAVSFCQFCRCHTKVPPRNCYPH